MARRKPSSSTPVRSVMGRKVISHSPPQFPASTDPLISSLVLPDRIETAGFDRNRPSRAGAEPLYTREPQLDYTQGGPVRNAGGSESFNTARTKRGRLSDFGKRSFKGA